ncbi:MAG: protease HtpX [Candidatus Binatia bacterium]
MAWGKRIVLFLSVNVLVLLTISIVTSLLGLRQGLHAYGIDYPSLMAFCLVWGMTGSFVSLALSRVLAKMMMGVQVIDPETRDPALADLVQTVYRLARGAHLPAMPEVGIYQSPEVNAFATGPTRARALVAVSTGLLQRMRANEIEGVLGHEVTHIANGDMVTMTLLQGVVNAFVLFLARAIAFAVTQGSSRDDDRPATRMMITIVLQIALSILGSMVVCAFSRWREFRADRGSAALAGREGMIAALNRLRSTVELVDDRQAAVASLKISGRPGGFMALLATHPPLEERIRRLEEMR